MYNKLFTKILDSSVWLESVTTRIVWLTFIASMDEDGFCAFAAMGNLANRARVTVPQCEQAVKVLESPDPQSADPEFEGRRIERVPGGWMILNAPKYRDLVTRVVARERTRLRVQKHRGGRGNAPVTASNASVTPSEAHAPALALSETHAHAEQPQNALVPKIQNPHGKSTNLVNGPELRRHGSHAWCSWPARDGLCVPVSLHREFVGKLGRVGADLELQDWYPTVLARFEGQAIGDDGFDFWRNQFADWVGTVTSKPQTRRLTRNEESIAASRRVLARLEGQKK